MTKEKLVKSPLNYVGGKYKLLPQILPLFPKKIDTFVDLFCGGANVGVNVNANKIICNDVNGRVIEVLNWFKINKPDYIIESVESIIDEYGLTNTSKHGYDYYGCNSSDGVAKVNKEKFLKLRTDYNNGRRDAATFYTLILYSFNNQIKFNRKGEFNTAVNKRDLNNNVKKNIINFVEQIHNQNIYFLCNDFRKLDINKLGNHDFVYCDPPYLITKATYNEQWGMEEELALFKLLDEIDKQGIKFALSNVLENKGKKNDVLIEWSKKYSVHRLNFHYGNSSYHAKNKSKNSTIEVLITNY